MKDKKGLEIAIGTLVVIILAVLVLAFLIFGFTMGFGNIRDKLFPFFSSKVNVDDVVRSCELACTSQSKYDYCDKLREVTFVDNGEKQSGITCLNLEETTDPISINGCKDSSGTDVVINGDLTLAKCKQAGGNPAYDTTKARWNKSPAYLSTRCGICS